MTELIYCEDDQDESEAKAAIKARFPSACFDDASDFIYTNRFEVTVDDVSNEEFWEFVITEGFALCCLGFQLTMRTDPARIRPLVEKVLPSPTTK